MVQGLGFRIQGSGLRVWGLGFRVSCFGFGVVAPMAFFAFGSVLYLRSTSTCVRAFRFELEVQGFEGSEVLRFLRTASRDSVP